jgi:hypothetical protein
VTVTEARPADTQLAPDSVEHLCCCQVDAVGEPTTSFCGKVEPYEGIVYMSFEDEPDACVVCLHLARVGHCPLRGRCVYADEE